MIQRFILRITYTKYNEEYETEEMIFFDTFCSKLSLSRYNASLEGSSIDNCAFVGKNFIEHKVQIETTRKISIEELNDLISNYLLEKFKNIKHIEAIREIVY